MDRWGKATMDTGKYWGYRQVDSRVHDSIINPIDAVYITSVTVNARESIGELESKSFQLGRSLWPTYLSFVLKCKVPVNMGVF